jgi:hypothetical protein
MEDLHALALQAIQLVRNKVQWKSGKAEPHLTKRIRRGHLNLEATLADYEAIIARVVNDPAADVYVYSFGNDRYPTIVADINGQRWLVMVDVQGVLETAFPPDDPTAYLSKSEFVRLGTLEELGL